MGKKQNNAGFSLLEVVLSMAILAILSIPLMSYFTQSMKYNAKMADKQHASVLAQEVMEDLKNQPNLVQKVNGGGYESTYLTGRHYTIAVPYPPAAPESGLTGGTVEYYGAADAINEKYDIRVKIGTDTTENASPVPQIDGIDGNTDVVALENGQLQDACSYFMAQNTTYAKEHHVIPSDQNTISNAMRRRIAITVKKESVQVACFYRCEGIDGVDATEEYSCSDYAMEDIENVENIFLMYEVNQMEDELEIRCEVGVSVPKLVIVCQNIDAVADTYKLVINPKDRCGMPEVASNIGMPPYGDSASGSMVRTHNGGRIWNGSYIMNNVEALTEKVSGVRKVKVEVSVYQKNKGNEADRDNYRYITVDSTKGE